MLISPTINKRTKAGKEEWAAFEADNMGKTILTDEEHDTFCSMASALLDCRLLQEAKEDACIESSIYFDDIMTGLQLKVRPDVWNHSIVVDLKTTNDASPRAFRNKVFAMGYHLQAAMISEALLSLGIEMEKFICVCVESKAPYATAVHILDDDIIEHGRKLLQSLLVDYQTCYELDRWPSYKINTISLSREV